MSKTILLVHGRHFKPPKAALQKLWFEALRHGIARDHASKLKAFNSANVEFVYYGDISNVFLSEVLEEPIPNDLEDRKATLAKLKRYKRSQFSKATYRNLPGYNPWMEGLADLFSGPLNFFGLSESIIESVAPDIADYWGEYRFGSDIRDVLTQATELAMKRNGDICVISHSLGCMVAYDVFWKLSHTSEYRNKPWKRDISLWITLGSPLADETVKDNLKGAGRTGEDQYPTIVNDWLNIAAEDDYISHDQKVAGDYREMRKLGLVDSIKDKRIYNVSVRNGKSNPHHGVGYLIHPKVADAVAAWL